MFMVCLFALYFLECLFWIRRDERAFTRSSDGLWKTCSVTPLSFTLLNRAPVLAAPLLLNPGFIRTSAAPQTDEARLLRRVARRLNKLWLLLALCRMQAFILLVYLPAVIFLHRLGFLWRLFVGLVIVFHLAIFVLAVHELCRVKKRGIYTTALSLACNPLGATRTLDVLSQAFFDRYSSIGAPRS
jgi:hypothetical protein